MSSASPRTTKRTKKTCAAPLVADRHRANRRNAAADPRSEGSGGRPSGRPPFSFQPYRLGGERGSTGSRGAGGGGSGRRPAGFFRVTRGAGPPGGGGAGGGSRS